MNKVETRMSLGNEVLVREGEAGYIAVIRDDGTTNSLFIGTLEDYIRVVAASILEVESLGALDEVMDLVTQRKEDGNGRMLETVRVLGEKGRA